MSESERVLRAVAAQRCTQLGQPHDRVARLLAKIIFIACGLALGGAALWLRDNINWVFIGR